MKINKRPVPQLADLTPDPGVTELSLDEAEAAQGGGGCVRVLSNPSAGELPRSFVPPPPLKDPFVIPPI